MGARALGWSIAILYFLQSWLTIMLPRTDKTLPLRAEYRNWHMLVGVALLVLLIARLRIWWRDERGLAPPLGLRSGVFNWARTLALATYLVLLAIPLFGFLFAWSDGIAVTLGPLFTLPAPIGESHRLWLFSGYFHSGGGFIVLVLTFAALLTAAYSWLRYGIGLIAAFPPGFGTQALLSMMTASYALATFKSPDPGPAAVMRYLGLVAIIAVIGWFLNRRRLPSTLIEEAPGRLQLPATLAVLGLVGLGVWGPNLMFRVTPWPVGDVISGPPGVTSHAAPVKRVSAWAATEYERKVASATYKWCGFCHTYTKNGDVKAGPSLYAIFGQKAGSVPNFHYSPAMAKAREGGLVWTDEKLDAFLADPDTFLPGTTMVISSGPVTDPKVRRAVINMLKRDVMKGDIDTVAAPAGQ